MKILKVRGTESLGKYDLDRFRTNLPGADLVIYNYENHGYEGSGFALWRIGKKYGYTYLGHCSCNGPVEDLNSILYTLPQIKKLTISKSYEWQYAGPVLARLKEYLAKEAETV